MFAWRLSTLATSTAARDVQVGQLVLCTTKEGCFDAHRVLAVNGDKGEVLVQIDDEIVDVCEPIQVLDQEAEI